MQDINAAAASNAPPLASFELAQMSPASSSLPQSPSDLLQVPEGLDGLSSINPLSQPPHTPPRACDELPRDDSDGYGASRDTVPDEPVEVAYPALQVRRAVFWRVLSGINHLGSTKKTTLLCRGALALAQVAALIVCLAITAKDDCDKPLRTFLALHITRVAIAAPLEFYKALVPARGQEEHPSHRVVGSPLWDARISLLDDVTNFAAIAIFVVGNWALWSSHTCQSDAPPLFWGSLAALIFGYFYVAEIALIALSIAFFLPLVLIMSHFFGISAAKPEIGPLASSEIDKIPLVIYVPKPEEADGTQTAEPESATDQIQVQPAASTASLALTASAIQGHRRKRRSQWLRLIKTRTPKSPTAAMSPKGQTSGTPFLAGPFPFYPTPANLSTCSICLCDYEDPPLKTDDVDPATVEWEILRLCPCRHVFHKACLDTWLATSGRCPICQVPLSKDGKANKRQSV